MRNVFDWYLPYGGGVIPSIWNRRCKAIEKELSEHCIKGVVSRHTLFDVDYYLVEVSDNRTYIDGNKIADALMIPKDWICLYHCKFNEGTYYAILERELNDKYEDCDGELVFRKPFSLEKYFINHDVDDFKCKFESLMDIEVCDWVYDSKTDTVLFRVLDEPSNFDRFKIASTLNISENSIGAYYIPDDNEWVYVMWLGD